MTTQLRPGGQTQLLGSVANAARVLREFGHGDTQLGITQLSRRLGIGKSSTHRIVHTLVAEKLLEKVESTGLFRLTETMRGLGYSAETALLLHQASTAVLDDLRKQTNQTVHVGILDGGDVLYVERRENPVALATFGRVGTRNLAQVTSTGKVLLAYLPEEERDRVVGGLRFVRRTPRSITNRQVLLGELAKVRKFGFALNVAESEPLYCSVAAPIRSRFGDVVAGVSLVVMSMDAEPLKAYTPVVVEAGRKISRNLGWRNASR